MSMKNYLFKNFAGIVAFGLSLQASAPQTNLQLGGYYENWSQYRGPGQQASGKGVFPSCLPQGFSKIASNLNILNYAFWIFNFNTQTPGVTGDWKLYPTEWDDIYSYGDGGLLAQAANLKQYNSNLKTMISIGGWNFTNPVYQAGVNTYGNQTCLFFSELLNNTDYQDKFIASLVSKGTSPDTTGYFWRTVPAQQGQTGYYYCDGIDIDYEYPGSASFGPPGQQKDNPTAANDYQGFITFIGKLRAAINTINSESCARPKLYLSVTLPPFLPSNLAVGSISSNTYPAGTPLAGKSYPAITIDPTNPSTYFAWYSIVANHCDWVNLMTYDMYGAGFSNSLVQYQCPLYNTNASPYSSTTLPDDSKDGAHSVDYAVWMWTTGAKDGAASNKDGIGIAPGQIQLGLPAYGRSYGSQTTAFNTNPVLQSYESYIAPNDPQKTPLWGGFSQKYTLASGTAAYFEIVPLLSNAVKMSTNSNPLTSLGSSPDQAQSFVVANSTKNFPANNVFVYDGPKDIATKVAYAAQQGLGGVFFYPISEDNFPITPAPGSVSTTGYDPSNTLFKVAADAIAAPKGNLGGSQNISTRTPNQ
jgi:GH18 family chitinase